MPKYKEIKIDLKVKPEVILGEILKQAAPMNTKQQVECESNNKNK